MPDLVTTSGKAIISSRLNGGGTTPLNIQIGTGATAPAAGDVALQTPLTPRVAGTGSQVTTTTTNDTFRVTGTVGPAAGYAGAITEAALFDNITAGNMLCRSTFGAITLTALDSIAFTFNVQFT